MKKINTKGFSLIELIVAVAILAAMAAMLIPSFISAQNDARIKKDEAKFVSMCTAFKTALGEPEVMKEVEDLCDNQKLTIVCYIDEEGLIVFGDGKLKGNLKTEDLEESTLWLNAYQSIGITYYTESKEFNEKYIVFNIVPKTSTTTASCEYSIEEESPI